MTSRTNQNWRKEDRFKWPAVCEAPGTDCQTKLTGPTRRGTVVIDGIRVPVCRAHEARWRRYKSFALRGQGRTNQPEINRRIEVLLEQQIPAKVIARAMNVAVHHVRRVSRRWRREREIARCRASA